MVYNVISAGTEPNRREVLGRGEEMYEKVFIICTPYQIQGARGSAVG
jgi:hypothetical protein